MHNRTILLGVAVCALGAGCIDIPDYSSMMSGLMAGINAAGSPGANPVHGTLTVRPPGAPAQTYSLRYCRSGQRESFSGVDLASDGPGGAVLRVVVDPIEGPRLRFQRQGGTPVVLDASHCQQLAANTQPTGTAINRITLVQGSVGLDCTMPDGTTFVGDAQYSSCHTSTQADDAITAVTDGGRLMALPEIPDAQQPAYLDPALRGLRVVPSVRIAGTVLGGDTVENAQTACLTSVRQFLQQIGWVTVYNPSAPHDLDVEMACTGSVMYRSIGGQTEIDLPDAQGPSVRIVANGQTVEEIAPAPRQWRCPLSGDVHSREVACSQRLSHANDARIAGILGTSQRLHEWAAQRGARTD